MFQSARARATWRTAVSSSTVKLIFAWSSLHHLLRRHRRRRRRLGASRCRSFWLSFCCLFLVDVDVRDKLSQPVEYGKDEIEEDRK